jgi:hypothetical protein
VYMATTADDIIEFATYGRPARCRVRLYSSPGVRGAVATELMEDNGGLSITNAAEFLWAAVTEKFGMTVSSSTFVEHYRKREGETFDVVTFRNRRFEGPTWSRLQRPALENLIGGLWLDSCIAAEVGPDRRREDPEALPCFHYRVIIHNFRFSANGVMSDCRDGWAAPELDQAHTLRNETARVILANPVMRRSELIGQLRSWAQPRFREPIDGSDCDPVRIVTAAEHQLEQPAEPCTICRTECGSVRCLRAEFRVW